MHRAVRARLPHAFPGAGARIVPACFPVFDAIGPVNAKGGFASRVAELEDEREYNRINLLLLRNTAFGNFLDRCAISLPCHRPGEAPVGLMLMGETMGDARLFSIAAAVEAVLKK